MSYPCQPNKRVLEKNQSIETSFSSHQIYHRSCVNTSQTDLHLERLFQFLVLYLHCTLQLHLLSFQASPAYKARLISELSSAFSRYVPFCIVLHSRRSRWLKSGWMGFRDCMMRCGSQQPAQLNLRVDEHGLGRVQAIHPELSELPAAATEDYRIVGSRRACAGNETF